MTKYFTNNFSVINLYKRPSVKSELVTQMIYGESFSITKKLKKWLKIKIKEGLKYAENLQKLKNSIDEPLVIILTLNTIAHTVGAIMVGVQAKITYSTLNVNNSYTFLGLQVTEDTLIGFVSTIMTILILLLSEIIPKTIGARYWDKLAKISTIILMSIIPFFKYTGILWILKFFTNIAGTSKRKSILKREDISTLAEIAEEQGVIKEKDSDLSLIHI